MNHITHFVLIIATAIIASSCRTTTTASSFSKEINRVTETNADSASTLLRRVSVGQSLTISFDSLEILFAEDDACPSDTLGSAEPSGIRRPKQPIKLRAAHMQLSASSFGDSLSFSNVLCSDSTSEKEAVQEQDKSTFKTKSSGQKLTLTLITLALVLIFIYIKRR